LAQVQAQVRFAPHECTTTFMAGTWSRMSQGEGLKASDEKKASRGILPLLEEREEKAVAFDDSLFSQEDYEDAWEPDYYDLERSRSSKPNGVHQTFVRMDEISKQVHRMSSSSLAHLQDFRKSLRDQGITDTHEQNEILLKHKGLRRDSFGTKTDESKDGECAWEAAEEHFLDDVSRSTMEEQFVRSVQPDARLDMHLMRMLGAEGESKLFLDYQRIVEYFRHKNAIADRKIGMKSMNMAMQSGDESLKELSTWHGEVRGKAVTQSSDLDDEDGLDDDDDDEIKNLGLRKKEHESSGNRGSEATSPPAATQGRRGTIMGMKKTKQESGRFKQLTVNTKPEEEEIEGRQADDGGSGASTPTSVHPGEEPVSPGNPRVKSYMRKGMGRLYRRPPGRTPTSGANLEVANDTSPTSRTESGEEEESHPSRLKVGGTTKISVAMKRQVAKARATIEERDANLASPRTVGGRPDPRRASVAQQVNLPDINQATPRGRKSISIVSTIEPDSFDAAESATPSSSLPQKPSLPAKPGSRKNLSRQRTKNSSLG